VKVTFDPGSMTLGEIEEFEEITGHRMEELGPKTIRTKDIVALIFLQERRVNPAYSLDDARAIKLSEFEFGPPTNAAPAAS
jgi:hypothetical protein